MRADLVRRVNSLSPGSGRQWGSMTVGQMLVHTTGQLRIGLGELKVQPRRLLMRYPPLRQLIVYLLPFPRGVPTAPELKDPEAGDWDADRAALLAAVERFGERGAETEWPEHPAFGFLSRRGWGVIAYRHLAHHLRQFGA